MYYHSIKNKPFGSFSLADNCKECIQHCSVYSAATSILQQTVEVLVFSKLMTGECVGSVSNAVFEWLISWISLWHTAAAVVSDEMKEEEDGAVDMKDEITNTQALIE